MAATNAQQAALGRDISFQLRVRPLFLQQAAVVYAESGATTGHATRVLLANKIAQSPGASDSLAACLATRTNLAASNVSYNFDANRVETDASDASISSQIATDWSLFAGA
jgi:hypothetical protein